MNDLELDRLLARTASYDDPVVAGLGLRDAYESLHDEIVRTPAGDRARSEPGSAVVVLEPGEQHPRRHRSWWLAVAAAAVALAVGVPVWLVRGGGAGQGVEAPYTSQAVTVAEANPRLLVAAPGWHVRDVGEFSAADGSITFVHRDRELEIDWRPARLYEGYLDDRRNIGPGRPTTVLGRQATTFSYSADDFTTILPVEGRSFLEIRGGVGDRAAYLDVLGRLEQVSVRRWLEAMPDSVVVPGEETKVADEMLADVPTPPGFDRATLPTGGANDYYQYGARVTGQVVCGWIEVYRAARADGDEARQRRAVDALESSRRWKVLRTMNAGGDWPEAIWETADDLRDGRLRSERQYAQGLGCDR